MEKSQDPETLSVSCSASISNASGALGAIGLMATATAAEQRQDLRLQGARRRRQTRQGQGRGHERGAAVDKLRTMGLSPVEIKENVAGTGLNREISLGDFDKGVELKDARRRHSAARHDDLSRSVAAQVARAILSEQTENKKLKTHPRAR